VVGEVVRKMEPDFAVVEFSLNKEETTMANYDYLIIGGGMTAAVDGIREVPRQVEAVRQVILPMHCPATGTPSA
jgi:hypothetical protein